MNTAIITSDAEERIQLTDVLQRAGLTVQAVDHFDDLGQTGVSQPIDLVVLVQPTDQVLDAIRHTRQLTAAPIIAITHFIHDDVRVSLYDAGADLVLVRPYSPRLLMVQAGMMAQHGFGMVRAQPSRLPFNRVAIPTPMSVAQGTAARLYS
jgi:DNA-binding response OmpR family regulator